MKSIPQSIFFSIFICNNGAKILETCSVNHVLVGDCNLDDENTMTSYIFCKKSRKKLRSIFNLLASGNAVEVSGFSVVLL